MPWLGFFNKMARADLYVIFNHVQFKKRYFENRNLIVSPQGKTRFIGVPVKTKEKYHQAISDVEIDHDQPWQKKLLSTVRHFYGKAPFFQVYFDELADIIGGQNHRLLMDLNMDIIHFFRKNLGISTPMIYSSDLPVESYSASDLVLQICRLQKADLYLCGASGRDYLKVEEFYNHQITIQWLDYVVPVYQQLCGEFIPNLSTLDLLFNHGFRSLDILMQN
jgi:WbqC-like protein family